MKIKKPEKKKSKSKYESLINAARVCRMYFQGAKTQADISDLLELSQPEVSNLIKLGLDSGIVKFETDKKLIPFDFETCLVETFNLKGAKVVRGGEAPHGNGILEDLGWVGAELFTKLAENNCKVGLSCGRGVNAVIEALEQKKKEGSMDPLKKIKIFSLITYIMDAVLDITPSALVGRLAGVLQCEGTAYQLPSNLKGSTLDLLRKTILKAIEKLDIYLIGIGDLEKPIKQKNQGNQIKNENKGQFKTLLEKEHLNAIKKYEGKAEIIHQIVGGPNNEVLKNEVFDDLKKSVIAMPCKLLQDYVKKYESSKIQTPGIKVMAVAGGPEKQESVYCALKGKYINYLVTDIGTAYYALEQEGGFVEKDGITQFIPNKILKL